MNGAITLRWALVCLVCGKGKYELFYYYLYTRMWNGFSRSGNKIRRDKKSIVFISNVITDILFG